MRAMASDITDPEIRAIMLRLANDYDLLAKRVAERASPVT
jgi:hypothetical protein